MGTYSGPLSIRPTLIPRAVENEKYTRVNWVRILEPSGSGTFQIVTGPAYLLWLIVEPTITSVFRLHHGTLATDHMICRFTSSTTFTQFKYGVYLPKGLCYYHSGVVDACVGVRGVLA